MASTKKSQKNTNKKKIAWKRPLSVRAKTLVVALLFGVVGTVLLQLTSAFTVQEDVAIHFTLGTQGIETGDGSLWESAGYNADGQVRIISNAVSATADPKLYQTQRESLSYFKVPNLPVGRYKVQLYFADTESTTKGQRVFALDAEGAQEHEGLDIWRKTSGVVGKAYMYDFNITVSDGELSLGFRPLAGKTLLSAVRLTPRSITGSLSNTPEPTPTPTPTPAPQPTPAPSPAPSTTPQVVTTPSGDRAVNVANSAQLTSALQNAQPGDVITLADGTYAGSKLIGKYTGSFGITVSGTASKPIILKGTKNAKINGEGLGAHYGLYFVGANYWYVEGITVTQATKGIVLDGSNNNTFSNILITETGQEGIHFRANSSDNIIQNSEVSYTGRKNATYGEGVYLGSANSNWGTYTAGQPDKSDRNKVLYNTIKFTGAESIDIKEGTTAGVIHGNSFDGLGMSGSWADSWIDVKGNNYTITNNNGKNSLLDGFQIHVAIAGWGQNTYIANNILAVNGPGYGLTVQAGANGTIWKCNNVVTAAASGTAVINGKTPLACQQ